MRKNKKPYKEPVFLFTSSSMRQAAWAGWYSALGNKELAEKYIHAAYSDWVKELGAGRKHYFLDRYNDDIWKCIPDKVLKKLVDIFFRRVKGEIKKYKLASVHK